MLAVFLVTAMIFWMRRTAASLSAHLRGEVERAAAIGAGALTVTAFLAVGREGLETTLFLWTAAKASGQTAGPLVGAAIGIAAAVILCWLLYRRAVHLNVGVFFNRTAIALIVIAAGVLAYGLGDLQDAGWLPGHAWVAFDLTAHIDPGSWWASIITGITELSPKMTVLQVTAWLAYLVVVIPAFVSAGRTAAAKRPPLQRPLLPPSWPGGLGPQCHRPGRRRRPGLDSVPAAAVPVAASAVPVGAAAPAGGTSPGSARQPARPQQANRPVPPSRGPAEPGAAAGPGRRRPGTPRELSGSASRAAARGSWPASWSPCPRSRPA